MLKRFESVKLNFVILPYTDSTYSKFPEKYLANLSYGYNGIS